MRLQGWSKIFVSCAFLLLAVTCLYQPSFAWYPVCVNCDETPSYDPGWDVVDLRPEPAVPRETEEQRRKREFQEITTRCAQLHNNGELDNAVACYQKALTLDPTSALVRENMNFALMTRAYYFGVHYYNQKDWKRAAGYFQEALNHRYDDNVRQYRDLARRMVEDEELQAMWRKEREEREFRYTEAQMKVRNMLDNLRVDFDQRLSQPSSELQFIEPEKPIFAKVDEKSVPVAVPTALLRPGSGPEASGKETNAEMQQLEKEYWDLEGRIKNEKDPVRRADLINRQTYVKSLMGVLEIQLMDKFKEKKAQDEREMKIKARLAIASSSLMLSKFDDSLEMLNKAKEEAPGDKGIQMALNYVNYIKDMSEGKVELNPQWPLLLDAITYGKGDWQASISYLKKAADEYTDNKNIRTALRYIEGMRAEETMVPALELPTADDLLGLFEGTPRAEEWLKLQEANEILEKAKRPDPLDQFADDWLKMTEEFFAAKEEDKEKSKKIDGLLVQVLIANLRYDHEAAYGYAKEAYELDPEDQAVRDTYHYMHGVVDAGRMMKRKNEE
ncbi:MAG: hypothetical protein FJZ09_00455 [Candidatus Omnitrophica bacterium]|nr:hypothetical protein [Candidatus Omnitrophota bacterium]